MSGKIVGKKDIPGIFQGWNVSGKYTQILEFYRPFSDLEIFNQPPVLGVIYVKLNLIQSLRQRNCTVCLMWQQIASTPI